MVSGSERLESTVASRDLDVTQTKIVPSQRKNQPHVPCKGIESNVNHRPFNCKGILLENSYSDNICGNGPDACPVFGYIVDGKLNIQQLKSSLEQVIRHFPVLSARMSPNGKQLIIPEEQGDLFSWTVEEHSKPMDFTPLPSTDVISINRFNSKARMDFYVPLKSTTVRRPIATNQFNPLIEVHIQVFSNKTVIGLSWNHLLTDGGGIAILLSLWSKALKGEPMPEASINYQDPLPAHYITNPKAPTGVVEPALFNKFRLISSLLIDRARYGPAEPRTIFIPKWVLNEWKSASPGEISSYNMVTAWILKGWASAFSSGTVSIIIPLDLRKQLPGIIPPTYMRNATSPRISPRPLKIADINKWSQLEVARVLHSFVQHFTPDVELNFHSYEFSRGGKTFRLLPEGNKGFALTSGMYFDYPKVDFGGKTESFEGYIGAGSAVGNMGTVWMEDGGARVNF